MYTVTWDSPADPQNPYNWPKSRKWLNVLIVSLQGTITPVASTILASGSFNVAADLQVTSTYVLTLPVALFVLGLGIGPLFLAPLSELYGRRIVYLTAFACFTALTVGCALSPTIAVLSVLRLLAGVAGSAGPSLGGGTIGDMFARHERGGAQALYGFGPTCGPVIGGIIGGFIANGTHGWRWLMWVMAIASSAVLVLSSFCLRETYGPVILHWKAWRLRKETGDETLRPKVVVDPREVFVVAITRPLRLLVFSPICTVMSIYMALIYGILYLHLVTVPLLYGPKSLYGLFSYEWQGGLVGLAYLGGGIGSTLGTIFCALTLNRFYAYMTARYGKPEPPQPGSDSELKSEDQPRQGRPEFRMPMMQLGKLIVPMGLFIYAWTAEKQPVPWPVPLLGAAIFCFGMLLTYVCIQTYIVDAFGIYAASALGATILLRSIFGCILSFVGIQLYVKLGYGWGTTMLGFVTLLFAPVPALLYFWGERLRAKPVV